MKNKTLYVPGFLLSLVLLLFAPASAAVDDFNVVVSIKPVHSIISGLMKDINVPELLVKGNSSPYDLQLSSSQREKLRQSNLLIWVGPELEANLQTEISTLPDTVRVFELLSSKHLKILPSRQNPDVRDPFFWMDDRNMMILLEELTQLLIDVDPARAHIYARNRLTLLKPLIRIDKEYEYGYRGMKAGLGVMYFDTLRYFEQAYALTTLGSVAASPLKKAEAGRILKVRNRIKSQQASCLFVDKSMPADHLELLTDKQSINIGELDVFGVQFEPGPDLYLQLMEYNTDVIKQCLNADMDAAAKARLAAREYDEKVVDGIMGRFILKDHMGQTVTDDSMKGHYSLVFFGYTHCPDICPTSLTLITSAFKKMGQSADRVQPYFITVDPKRDTVKVMQDYVQYFDSRLTGLTGSESMIERVAAQFRAKYEKVEVEGEEDRYLMDHTASFSLMAPDGTFVTRFANAITADVLAEELMAIIR